MTPICFGRYVLIERIACGGMGEVFIAAPRSLWGFEKFFAIKKILPSLSKEPEFLSRFRDEARLVIPLNHPNVVQVYEVGRVGEEYFIAMEWVDGKNVGQILRTCMQRDYVQCVSIPAALFIVREVLAGLEYCHRQTDASGGGLGMVHRDVSPSNVLISYEGAVKLTDFGLALSKHKKVRTKPNLVLGHLGYIAPEAMEGRKLDGRADIFSTGVMLFELLTGQHFITGNDPVLFRRMLAERVKLRPSQLRQGIPANVDSLFAKAVTLNPDDRFATAGEFHDAIQQQLVRLDPLFSSRQLSTMLMHRYFDAEKRKKHISTLMNQLDLEEAEINQPAARTICIGEAIPIVSGSSCSASASHLGVLTVIEEDDLFDGDTEPFSLAESQQSSQTDSSDSISIHPRSGGYLSRRDPHRRSRLLTPKSDTEPLPILGDLDVSKEAPPKVRPPLRLIEGKPRN